MVLLFTRPRRTNFPPPRPTRCRFLDRSQHDQGLSLSEEPPLPRRPPSGPRHTYRTDGHLRRLRPRLRPVLHRRPPRPPRRTQLCPVGQGRKHSAYDFCSLLRDLSSLQFVVYGGSCPLFHLRSCIPGRNLLSDERRSPRVSRSPRSQASEPKREVPFLSFWLSLDLPISRGLSRLHRMRLSGRFGGVALQVGTCSPTREGAQK